MYGRASNNRPIEEIRMSGPAPSMSNLVQGTFMYEWVDKNQARKEALNAHHKKIIPLGTKATQGHAAGASKSKQAGEVGGKTWKMWLSAMCWVPEAYKSQEAPETGDKPVSEKNERPPFLFS